MREKYIGITGHQIIPEEAMSYVKRGIVDVLNRFNQNIICVSSIAAGADQLFAQSVMSVGGQLYIIIPCDEYETTFKEQSQLDTYRRLIANAAIVEKLDFKEPSEEAFYAAGREVADLSDTLVAIWDGKTAKGKGGTADIVNYAKNKNKEVIILWPSGVDR